MTRNILGLLFSDDVGNSLTKHTIHHHTGFTLLWCWNLTPPSQPKPALEKASVWPSKQHGEVINGVEFSIVYRSYRRNLARDILYLSFCPTVILSETLTLRITFEQWVLKLWYFTWVFLVIRPFCLNLTFWP